MKILFFVQSLISDWNHGNAHFLRGIVTELKRRGHIVRVYEPSDSWSLNNLIKFEGKKAIYKFHEFFPDLSSVRYNPDSVNLDSILENADLVIVHEWNDPDLVKKIGIHRRINNCYKLLFHDTHHRVVTSPKCIEGYDFKNYDGVLAFGDKIRSIYIEKGLIQRAWTWHEAADTTVFRPIENRCKKKDLVWVGNWGDEERSNELKKFLFEPVKALNLKCNAYGVRFPKNVISLLSGYGINYCGWIPNYRVPEIFSQYLLTIHIPRKPYVQILRGIPTIRVFEALACGIPLICSPWEDCEGLFRSGKDYLIANSSKEMEKLMRMLINDKAFAEEIASNGLETVIKKHTCFHRVDELLGIVRELNGEETDNSHKILLEKRRNK